MPVTVFDILAKRNADKLRAVSADGASVRYHLRMSDGVVGIIDTFELLDGVSLMFNSIPRGTAEWGDVEPRELQIDWCLRGRFELETANGRTIRLGEGELAFHDERVRKRVMSFPAPLYTGLTLRIDRSAGAAALERALPECAIDLDGLTRRLTGDGGCTICTPDPSMHALLASFWDVDERAPLARLRLKALELVALADATPHLSPRAESYQRKDAIESLERGMKLLESDFEQDVTLCDAANAAHLSVSSFKERFAKAFGIPPMAYRRQCRLDHAAQLLETTNEGIAQIALSVGYRNPSKFSAAFAATFSRSPSEYRALHRSDKRVHGRTDSAS